jgi:hypothetical protein
VHKDDEEEKEHSSEILLCIETISQCLFYHVRKKNPFTFSMSCAAVSVEKLFCSAFHEQEEKKIFFFGRELSTPKLKNS